VNISNLSKKHDYINALLKIQKDIPSAIIAGGAIRDQYHGKEINDIDIYVPESATKFYSVDYWTKMFDLKIGQLFSSDDIELLGEVDDDGEYTEKNHISGVWDISKSGTKYNIIATDIDPIEYVERYFDVGLCKAYCNGKKLHFSADFIHDSKFKRLTLVAEDIEQEEFNRMMDNHINKLQHKYPTHTLVIPPKYDDLYKEYKGN
jgi:hypothetical protein